LEPNVVFPPHFFQKIILHSSDPIKQSGDAIDRLLGCLSLSEGEQHGMHDGLWRNFFFFEKYRLWRKMVEVHTTCGGQIFIEVTEVTRFG